MTSCRNSHSQLPATSKTCGKQAINGRPAMMNERPQYETQPGAIAVTAAYLAAWVGLIAWLVILANGA